MAQEPEETHDTEGLTQLERCLQVKAGRRKKASPPRGKPLGYDIDLGGAVRKDPWAPQPLKAAPGGGRKKQVAFGRGMGKSTLELVPREIRKPPLQAPRDELPRRGSLTLTLTLPPTLTLEMSSPCEEGSLML